MSYRAVHNSTTLTVKVVKNTYNDLVNDEVITANDTVFTANDVPRDEFEAWCDLVPVKTQDAWDGKRLVADTSDVDEVWLKSVWGGAKRA